jgi:alkylated DNA repair dioxygenase AlkB
MLSTSSVAPPEESGPTNSKKLELLMQEEEYQEMSTPRRKRIAYNNKEKQKNRNKKSSALSTSATIHTCSTDTDTDNNYGKKQSLSAQEENLYSQKEQSVEEAKYLVALLAVYFLHPAYFCLLVVKSSIDYFIHLIQVFARSEKNPDDDNEDIIPYYRIRRYSSNLKGFMNWETFLMYHKTKKANHNNKNVCENLKNLSINLNQGGRLTIHREILEDDERKSIESFMDKCNLYRQYKIRGFREPRVHVLLSSTSDPEEFEEKKNNGRGKNVSTDGYGYRYHGVKMKALPLAIAPRKVHDIAKRLAKRFCLQNEEWNIGLDLIVYRNGKDGIGWHADDTQGESLILTVIISSDRTRIIKIRPKRGMHLKDGDEEIEILLVPGDGYSMDEIMQIGYEHSVPPKPDSKGKRKVIVFRQGSQHVCEDNGLSTTDQPSLPKKRIWFGPPPIQSGIVEGETCHSRDFLSESNVHGYVNLLSNYSSFLLLYQHFGSSSYTAIY